MGKVDQFKCDENQNKVREQVKQTTIQGEKTMKINNKKMMFKTPVYQCCISAITGAGAKIS